MATPSFTVLMAQTGRELFSADSGSRLNPAWTLKRSYGKQSNTDLSQSLTLDTAKDPTQIGVFVNGW